MFTVYALYSRSFNKIYIGQTSDISNRILQHNSGSLSKFTKKYIPWEIIYTEEVNYRSDALIREKQLKSKKVEILFGKL